MREKIKIGKKGSERVLSIWHFIVFGIIGLGIVAAVWLFYSAEVDVREIEILMLQNKLYDCVVEQGFVDEFLEEEIDVFGNCGLNKEIIEEDFYFRVLLENSAEELKRIDKGVRSFEKDCEVVLSGVEAKRYPKCFMKNESVLYHEGSEIKTATIKFLTASNQQGRKISVAENFKPGGGEFGGGGASDKF